ncbi:MAG: signal peptide peptidase SppA, partial [Desulfovibrio sp.]
MQETRSKFSQRHPLLFGFMIITAAVVLLIGAMAVFRFYIHGGAKFMGLPSLGLVHVEGVILDSRPVVDFIAELREDPEVVGVVIRVESPGGGIGPSQEIHRAVKKLAERKPVVVSMGALAASGGYYVSCPADSIYANPGTLTGSIGVIMQVTNLEGLMDTLGIDHQSFISGPFKDTPSPFGNMTLEEEAYLQGIIMDLHDQFVLDVAEGRAMDEGDVRELADGRIYTGRQALQNGLVDQLGGLEDAFDALKQLCEVTEDLPIKEGPVFETNFLEDIMSSI